MGAFFQELTPEIKVTASGWKQWATFHDHNIYPQSEFGGLIWHIIWDMLLQNSHRPGKILPWSWKTPRIWKKGASCPGIVLEFCKIILENMNKSLKNIKIHLVLSDLWDAQKTVWKSQKKHNWMKIAGYTSKSEVQLVFYSIQFVR